MMQPFACVPFSWAARRASPRGPGAASPPLVCSRTRESCATDVPWYLGCACASPRRPPSRAAAPTPGGGGGGGGGGGDGGGGGSP